MVARTRRSAEKKTESITELIKRLPTVPEQHRPREIVVHIASDDEIKALELKGYKTTVLMFLPREKQDDAIVWFLKYHQGVTDGTLTMTTEQEKAIVNDMRMRGLYSGKVNNFDALRKEISKDVDDILNWKKSTHQLKGVTTSVSQEEMLEFVKLVRKTLGKQNSKH